MALKDCLSTSPAGRGSFKSKQVNKIIFLSFSSVLFPKELDQIFESHTHFMKDLEMRLQNGKLQGIVGDIFTKLSSSYHVSTS